MRITKQAVLSGVLVLLGVFLVGYGLFWSSQTVYAQRDNEAVLEAEIILIREVTVGGVARDHQGKIRRTYTGAAPSFCPT
jgi:hypothetical protein